jgi:hypothetical protein
MHNRFLPALIVLAVLALVATACSVPQDAQPGPSLAPKLAAIASAAAAASEEEQATSGVSCAENACKKDLNSATDAQGASAPAVAQLEPAAIALPEETRTDSEGSVSVAVTPAGSAAGTLIFDVAMNTHSVELDYDMTKIATLRDDQGQTYTVKDWNGASGGHHRQGTLTFVAPSGAAPRSLELNLAGISGVPSRLFKWAVKQGGKQ